MPDLIQRGPRVTAPSALYWGEGTYQGAGAGGGQSCPLRTRLDDIPLLTRQIENTFNEELSKIVSWFSESAMDLFTMHHRRLPNQSRGRPTLCHDTECVTGPAPWHTCAPQPALLWRRSSPRLQPSALHRNQLKKGWFSIELPDPLVPPASPPPEWYDS